MESSNGIFAGLWNALKDYLRHSSLDIQFPPDLPNNYQLENPVDKAPLIGRGPSSTPRKAIFGKLKRIPGENRFPRIHQKSLGPLQHRLDPYEQLPEVDEDPSCSSTAYPFEEIDDGFSTVLQRPTNYADSTIHNSKWQSRGYRHPSLLVRIICASPAILGATTWASLCIYFLDSYLSLPRLPSGKLPRIGTHYALWPYISCIGATKEELFKAASITTALCIVSAFSIDYYLGKDIVQGIWWRRAKTVFGFNTSAFLIALAFASINGTRHPGQPDVHMIFTSIHIWSAVCAKFCDFMLSYRMRKVNRTNRILRIARYWKKMTGLFAAPCATMTMIGIYGCDGDPKITTPGSKCYKIASGAAITEWILAICFINYLLALGFCSFHGESIRADMLRSASLALVSRAPSPPKPPKSRMSRFLTGLKHVFC